MLGLAEQRAAILRRLGVRNVAEADAAGVHLRRVYVLVDEVAELAHDHPTDKIADQLLRELLLLVLCVPQRVVMDLMGWAGPTRP